MLATREREQERRSWSRHLGLSFCHRSTDLVETHKLPGAWLKLPDAQADQRTEIMTCLALIFSGFTKHEARVQPGKMRACPNMGFAKATVSIFGNAGARELATD